MFKALSEKIMPRVQGFMNHPKFGEQTCAAVVLADADIAAIKVFLVTGNKDSFQKLTEKFVGPEANGNGEHIVDFFDKPELREKTHRVTVQFLACDMADGSPDIIVEVRFYRKEGTFQPREDIDWKGAVLGSLLLTYHAGKPQMWMDESWRLNQK